MTQQEMAIKLASASACCSKMKCPFTGTCKGAYESCAMKDVALMIRSDLAEIDALRNTVTALKDILIGVNRYIIDLEKINKRYRDIIVGFGMGYRPRKPGKIRKVPKKHISKLKKDPVEMDGDERYAFDPEPKTEPEPPVVMI